MVGALETAGVREIRRRWQTTNQLTTRPVLTLNSNELLRHLMCVCVEWRGAEKIKGLEDPRCVALSLNGNTDWRAQLCRSRRIRNPIIISPVITLHHTARSFPTRDVSRCVISVQRRAINPQDIPPGTGIKRTWGGQKRRKGEDERGVHTAR